MTDQMQTEPPKKTLFEELGVHFHIQFKHFIDTEMADDFFMVLCKSINVGPYQRMDWMQRPNRGMDLVNELISRCYTIERLAADLRETKGELEIALATTADELGNAPAAVDTDTEHVSDTDDDHKFMAPKPFEGPFDNRYNENITCLPRALLVRVQALLSNKNNYGFIERIRMRSKIPCEVYSYLQTKDWPGIAIVEQLGEDYKLSIKEVVGILFESSHYRMARDIENYFKIKQN